MSKNIQQLMRVAQQARDPQWLKDALQAAIALEVSTLPPYLIGMWSIADTTPGSPGAAAYKLIDSVVRQEMGHMGLVCNMLTAIGGTPQIAAEYQNSISYPGPLPGGVRPTLTVYLSGLTKPYVHDVFMSIEFPENGPIPFALGAQVFPTIGAFYDAIADAFSQLQFTPITANQLASPGVGVTKIVQPGDVKTAIDLIKTQGEGTAQTPEDGIAGELAHYYRFAELYIGKLLVAQPGGGFQFNGPAFPFPEAITIAPLPPGGYQHASSTVQQTLTTFNSIFSEMLDKLDQAWSSGSQATLGKAVGLMGQLRAAAKVIMANPLPLKVDGFYGPEFKYLPPGSRTLPGQGGPVVGGGAVANPVFADIVALLRTLTGNDPSPGSPHGDFWNSTYEDFMAQKTDDWGVPGNLVTKGQPDASNLHLALAGKAPFGIDIPRMPVNSIPNSRFATTQELQMVALWITNGCPK